MTNKSEKTIVVFRAPGLPLVCLRASDLPVPLDVGQVFDFDAVLYQQMHKAIVSIGRTAKGTINDANTMLKGLILRLYGEDELAHTLALGTINYSAVSCTNEKLGPGGIRMGVLKLLADDGEDLVLVDCRIVNAMFLREALSTTARSGSSATVFGLTGLDFESTVKPLRLAAEAPTGTAKNAERGARKKAATPRKTS